MLKVSITAALLSCTAISAFGQELPDPKQLRELAIQELPSFWKPKAFELVARAKGGDPIKPTALIRYELDVAPDVDLFTATGRTIGPFSVTLRTYAAGAKRRLYGTMELFYRAGNWSGTSKVENPVVGLGQPLDMFIMPTLVQGSKEENELLVTLRDDKVSQMKAEILSLEARHAQEIANAEAALQASLTKALETYEPSIGAQKDKLKKELEALRKAQEAEIDALSETQEKKLRTQTVKHEERIAQMNATRDDKIAEMRGEISSLKARHAQEVADAEASLQARLAKALETYEPSIEAEKERLESERRELASKHEAELYQLKAAQQTRLAKIEREYEEQRKQLRESTAKALQSVASSTKVGLAKAKKASEQRIAATQAELAKSDEEIAAKQSMIEKERAVRERDRKLQAEIAQTTEKRQGIVASLAGNWSGRVECEKRNSSRWYTFTASFKPTGTGDLAGNLTVNAETLLANWKVGRPLPAVMSLLSGVGENRKLAIEGDNNQGNHNLDEYFGLRVEWQAGGTFSGEVAGLDDCMVQVTRR